MNLSSDDLGPRFWLMLFGLVLAAVAVGILAFILIGGLWYAFGFLGGFIVFCGILLGVAWVYDRRERDRRKRLAA